MRTGARDITIDTPNFGRIQVPEEKVICFREGIPGFPAAHEFAILDFETLQPFRYLQSLGEPPVALLIVSPFVFVPDYRFDLSAADMEELQAGKTDEVTAFAVATIPSNPAEATINLMAPVVVNLGKRCGKQVILLEGSYSMRHPLFSPAP